MKAVCRSVDDLIGFTDRVRNKLGTTFDKPIQVTVKPFKRDRSLDQNAKVHAMIRVIAEYAGYTESAMKAILVDEYAPRHSVKLGEKVIDAPLGTSDMNVEQMSEFIEHLYQLGADLELTFSD